MNQTQKSYNIEQLLKFIFVGGNTSKLKPNQAITNALALNSNYILLSNVQVNDWVAIAKIDTDRNTRNYLKQLGLKSGIIVKIISKTANKSVIVAIEDRHIGLGAKIAQQVIVTLANCN